MSIKCLMNGMEVNYPCSHVCALFGDCVTAFEAQKKENVRTNADRIRAMSDEELNKFICSMVKCEYRQFELWGRCELFKWLQQPADNNRPQIKQL